MKLYPHIRFKVETDLTLEEAKEKLQNLFDVPLKPYVKPKVSEIYILLNEIGENLYIKNRFFNGEIKGDKFIIYQETVNTSSHPFFKGMAEEKLGKEGEYITKGEFFDNSEGLVIGAEISCTFNAKVSFGATIFIVSFLTLMLFVIQKNSFVFVLLIVFSILYFIQYFIILYRMRLKKDFLIQFFEAK